jgi:hypothetical protein
MRCKRPAVPEHFLSVDNLFHELQLNPHITNKPVTLTFEETSCVSEQPVKMTTWVGIPERALPCLPHHIQKPWELGPP